MWTLARHNMWTVEAFPLFRNGLEPIQVSLYTAWRVQWAGGTLFPDVGSAWDAAVRFMYPGGDTSEPPNPEGRFLSIPLLGSPLFLPKLSTNLIAT